MDGDCQRLAGFTFARVQAECGLSQPQTASPPAEGQGSGKRAQEAGHRGGGGREAGGAQRIPISLLPLPPKGLVLVLGGDLELCGAPLWFAKGKVAPDKHIHQHMQPGHPHPQPDLGALCRVGAQ